MLLIREISAFGERVQIVVQIALLALDSGPSAFEQRPAVGTRRSITP